MKRCLDRPQLARLPGPRPESGSPPAHCRRAPGESPGLPSEPPLRARSRHTSESRAPGFRLLPGTSASTNGFQISRGECPPFCTDRSLYFLALPCSMPPPPPLASADSSRPARTIPLPPAHPGAGSSDTSQESVSPLLRTDLHTRSRSHTPSRAAQGGRGLVTKH